MLQYRAQFPVQHTKSCRDIWPLARKWILGSPHTSFSEGDLATSSDATFEERSAEGELVTFARGKAHGYESFGVKYVKRETSEPLSWTTTLVGTQDDEKFWVSVSVECDSSLAGIRIPSSKKPYVIRQLLDQFGGGDDGPFPVSQAPHTLRDDDVELAASIITGSVAAQMPVVYLSTNDQNQLYVDAGELAKWLAGLAHVLVEPSRAFSFALREQVGGRNVFGGSVGIYWAGGVHTHASHWWHFDDPHDHARDIERTVRRGLIGQREIEQCSWSHLNQLRVRSQIEELKDSDSASIDEYVEAFDEEIRLKDERIKRAEDEVNRLNALLLSRQHAKAQTGRPILYAGQEPDLYNDEIAGIVLEVLEQGLTNSHKGSRREHVLKDLIQKCSGSERRGEIIQALKTTLGHYKKMSKSVKSQLQDLGFTISEDGKHFKIVFCNDPRYQHSLPKTSSDHRAGKNLVSQLINSLM